MNYIKHYNSLIDKYKKLNLPKLKIWDPDSITIETHHIIPRCLNGNNDETNLVNLTSKAHFVAHHLLYKANIGTNNEFKLLKAFGMILYGEDYRSQRRRVMITSKIFQNIRNQLSICNSIQAKNHWKNITEEQEKYRIMRSHTKEVNEKRRLTCSKVKKTVEWNKKNSLAHLGKKHSQYKIDKIKQGLKRFWNSDEGQKKKKKLSQKHKDRKPWNKGLFRTKTERQKMSEGRMRNYQLQKLCSVLGIYIKRNTSGNN